MKFEEKKTITLIIDRKLKNSFDSKSQQKINELVGRGIKILSFQSKESFKFKFEYLPIVKNTFSKATSPANQAFPIDQKIMQICPDIQRDLNKRLVGKCIVLESLAIDQDVRLVFEFYAVPSATATLMGNKGGYGPRFNRRI